MGNPRTTIDLKLLKIGDFVDVLGRPEVKALLPDPSCWYLLRVHPGRERMVGRAFKRRNVWYELPTFMRDVAVHGQRWRFYSTPRMRRLEVPIFPGFIFVPDHEADLDRLKSISDHVTSFLKFGDGEAAPIKPALMQAILELQAELASPQAQSRRWRRLKVGQTVSINGGPFAMWTGRIERLDGKGRIRVLLNILKREVPVAMTEDQVEPV